MTQRKHDEERLYPRISTNPDPTILTPLHDKTTHTSSYPTSTTQRTTDPTERPNRRRTGSTEEATLARVHQGPATTTKALKAALSSKTSRAWQPGVQWTPQMTQSLRSGTFRPQQSSDQWWNWNVARETASTRRPGVTTDPTTARLEPFWSATVVRPAGDGGRQRGGEQTQSSFWNNSIELVKQTNNINDFSWGHFHSSAGQSS